MGVPGGSVVRLPMQETRVRSLVQEDPTCLRATKPVLHNKRSHHSEKPERRNQRAALTATREETRRQQSPSVSLTTMREERRDPAAAKPQRSQNKRKKRNPHRWATNGFSFRFGYVFQNDSPNFLFIYAIKSITRTIIFL